MSAQRSLKTDDVQIKYTLLDRVADHQSTDFDGLSLPDPVGSINGLVLCFKTVNSETVAVQ